MRTFSLAFLSIMICCCVGSVAADTGGALSAPSPTLPQDVNDIAGKTVLYYNDAHGNQIEYMAPDGRSYLWYPGNFDVVVGQWRFVPANGIMCFKYGANTYNPVTKQSGGNWDCRYVGVWSEDIVDIQEGNVFRLQDGDAPFRLPAKPKYYSIRAMLDKNAAASAVTAGPSAH